MTKHKKAWSHGEGPHGHKIRVFEDTSSKTRTIYGEMADKSLACGRRSMSLGHSDKARAILWAKEQVRKWEGGGEVVRDTTPTASHLFSLYQRHRTIRKVLSEQQADRRRAEMWVRWLGPAKDMSKLSLRDWETFLDARRSGEINALGEKVAEPTARRTVRDGTLWGDCVFLLSVLNWAARWRENDRYLLSENVARGFPLPRERNVRRPVVNMERFLAVRAKAGEVMMRVGRGKDAREEVSYTPELLDLAWHTGRRIAAILALRYVDLKLSEGPNGAITWPSDSDKCKKEWSAPINSQVRVAINLIRANRQLKGSRFLFPSPNDLSKPLSKELASAWLCRAEALAEVEHFDGGAWHPFRRGWATSRKHLPDVDVAAAGGWSDLTSLKTCYQQADMATMVAVVAEPAKLIEGGT